MKSDPFLKKKVGKKIMDEQKQLLIFIVQANENGTYYI